MKQLTPDGDLDGFFRHLGRAGSRVLFLDYDGTLAPFREKRDEAFPAPGVRDVLEKLYRKSDTRLVFVSGRSIEDLLALLGLTFTPEIWGSHGREHLLPDGSRELVPLDDETRSAFSEAEEWAGEMGWEDCFEKKAGCVALHWRPFSSSIQGEVSRAACEKFQQLADAHGLEVHHFDGGVEIQTPGVDKGVAINRVLDQYTGTDVAAAFLGDDLTDEDGFRVLKGRGLGVLVREEFRSTDADVWLGSIGQALDFLDRWISNSPVPEGEIVNE